MITYLYDDAQRHGDVSGRLATQNGTLFYSIQLQVQVNLLAFNTILSAPSLKHHDPSGTLAWPGLHFRLLWYANFVLLFMEFYFSTEFWMRPFSRWMNQNLLSAKQTIFSVWGSSKRGDQSWWEMPCYNRNQGRMCIHQAFGAELYQFVLPFGDSKIFSISFFLNITLLYRDRVWSGFFWTCPGMRARIQSALFRMPRRITQ